MQQADEFRVPLSDKAPERRETELQLRRCFQLQSLPRMLDVSERRYSVLAALEPGEHIAIDLACGAAGALTASISFPCTTDAALAAIMVKSIWPEVILRPGEASEVDKAATCGLLPLMPRQPQLVDAAGQLALPHDPALWPWRINEALSVMRNCGGALRISMSAPWNRQAVARRIDVLAQQVQIAQLRQPALPLIHHWQMLIAALRHDAQPIELLVECSADIGCGERALLCLLLFGEPEESGAGRSGTLCLARRLPVALLPTSLQDMRLPQAGDCVGPPAGSLILGKTSLGGDTQLQAADRMRHLYVLGGTGTGKSTLMRRLIQQDIAAGEGVILIDPHGDLAAEVIAAMPSERQSDLVVAEAAKGTLALPLLPRHGSPLAIERAVDGLVSLFIDALYDYNKEAFGPVFEQYFRSAFTLICHAPEEYRRLENMPRVFEDHPFRRELLAHCPDRQCASFWRKTAEQTGGDMSFANMTAYVTSKLTRLIGGEVARQTFSGDGSELDLAGVLERAGVLIVPCPKGELGEGFSRLVTTAMLMRLRQAAMARTGQMERRPVRVYIDEFQGARGSELAMLLAEGRKYGLALTLANQSIGQLGGVAPGSLGSAVLANAGNLALFRLGGPDALQLAPWLGGEVGWRELCSQPDFRFSARLLQDGRPQVYADLRPPTQEQCQ